MTDTMPFNLEAEEALLGAVIINPSTFALIDLQPGEFFIERHQWVWKAFIQLQIEGKPVDLISLTERIKKNGQLKEIGGEAFLTSFINRTPSSLNAEQYASIIRDKANRRKMILTAQELAAAAFDEKADINEVSASVTDRLASTVSTKHEMIHISEAIPQVIDIVIEKSKNPNETYGIPTGFIDLDTLTGGLQGLWYLAGEPGIGKSILMLQVLINAAKNGNAGAIFSLEMSTLAQMMRAVSAQGEIPTRNLRTGKIDADEWDRFYKACSDLANLPIYICDEPQLSTNQLRAHILKLKAKIDLKVFALDYLYLMTDNENLKPTERTELLSKRVKSIQRQTDVIGLTVNSVTKEGMNGNTSNITAIRGSGQLGHDADVVLFINKHEIHDNMRTISLKKGRDIESLGKLDLVKMDEWPLFKNAERKVPVRDQYYTGPRDEEIPV